MQNYSETEKQKEEKEETKASGQQQRQQQKEEKGKHDKFAACPFFNLIIIIKKRRAWTLTWLEAQHVKSIWTIFRNRLNSTHGKNRRPWNYLICLMVLDKEAKNLHETNREREIVKVFNTQERRRTSASVQQIAKKTLLFLLSNCFKPKKKKKKGWSSVQNQLKRNCP